MCNGLETHHMAASFVVKIDIALYIYVYYPSDSN